MSNIQENLNEFYLNYDTANLLKERSSTDDIIELFKNEINYPEDLTESFLKFNKSYINSVIMRIKIREKQLEAEDLKKDLLNFNKDLKPILNKLLNNKIQQDIHDNLEEIDINNDLTESNKIINNDMQNNINTFIRNYLIKTNDKNDFIKVSVLFEKFLETVENSDSIEKTVFKECLIELIGKPINNGYKGFKII